MIMQQALTKEQSAAKSVARLPTGTFWWHPPCLSWIKLNTDGAVGFGSSKASYRGVICDHNAYDLGYRCLEVESDSLDAINLVKGLSTKQNCPTLALHIHESCN
ncbi:hypothetical protein V6N12_058951 [Hibiscus sabdariffa]|uniref:RNase H type-1 domain-containing protein n=1 Tax=Hibiscus sabdariffa TaxID=183260 RepID=A0ABR2ETP2_9ROSI